MQKSQPVDVIVVNDGGDGETEDIVRSFGYTNINVHRPDFNATGTKVMPALINIGLRRAKKLKPSYIAIMGADHIIPKHYYDTLLTRMRENEKIAISSGIIKGEPISSYMPRGSGRLIRVSWWKRYNVQYIVAHGWEPWLIYRAISDGFLVRVYRDLETFVTRRTVISPRKLYYYGKGDRFIGHSPIFVLGRAASYMRRNVKHGVYLIAGYLSEQEVCDGIKNVVRLFERYRVSQAVDKVLTRFL
jgi:glycosyltransferase involved in cell wall biosynthesis